MTIFSDAGHPERHQGPAIAVRFTPNISVLEAVLEQL